MKQLTDKELECVSRIVEERNRKDSAEWNHEKLDEILKDFNLGMESEMRVLKFIVFPMLENVNLYPE